MPESRRPDLDPLEAAQVGRAGSAQPDHQYIVVCRELRSGVATYVGPFPHREAAERHASEAAAADPVDEDETFEYRVAPLSRRDT